MRLAVLLARPGLNEPTRTRPRQTDTERRERDEQAVQTAKPSDGFPPTVAPSTSRAAGYSLQLAPDAPGDGIGGAARPSTQPASQPAGSIAGAATGRHPPNPQSRLGRAVSSPI